MTGSARCLLLFLCTILYLHLFEAHLHSTFRHFEIITPRDMKVRVKRDAVTNKTRSKTVSFFSLGKQLTVLLQPGSPVLDDNFQINVENEDGSETSYTKKVGEFYTGYLLGDPDSGVDASYGGGFWTILITFSDGTLVVEPADIHDPLSLPRSMVVYRDRDVKMGNASLGPDGKEDPNSFCEVVDLCPNKTACTRPANWTRFPSGMFQADGDESHGIYGQQRVTRQPQETEGHYGGTSAQTDTDENKTHRSRRESTIFHDTCDIHAIADYTLYRGYGKNSTRRVVRTLISVYQAADRLFRRTVFKNYVGIGIKVKDIKIRKKPTLGQLNYNSASPLSPNEIINAMVEEKEFFDYCLIHVTTDRHFGVVLGLAAIAKNGLHDWTNGICGGVRGVATNVGLSTVRSSNAQYLPLNRYVLILTHEIGHNFGARHDDEWPSEKSCSPTSNKGGKYIMWKSASTGREPNNEYFSPCSRNSVGDILEKKSSKCLVPRKVFHNFCGNSVVDPSEECDPGFDAGDDDKCCTMNCRFRGTAICSPLNHPCCTEDCQIAPTTQTCKTNPTQECLAESNCSGTSFDKCPPASALPNGSPCFADGQCMFARCVSYCELLGMNSTPTRQMASCACDQNLTAMCLHCCFDRSGGGTCEPVGGAYADETPCVLGSCLKGVCVPTTVDNLFELSNVRMDMEAAHTSDMPRKIVGMAWVFFGSTVFVISALIIGTVTYHKIKTSPDEEAAVTTGRALSR